MNRGEIIEQLHQIIDTRLFGDHSWPPDREVAAAVQTTLIEMGLIERAPGYTDSWRCTPLGSEQHLHLLQVFMGVWDEWEIPTILEQYGLIEEAKVYYLWRVLSKGADWESTLKRFVRRAYLCISQSKALTPLNSSSRKLNVRLGTARA
jgi:hypothetical protein